MPFVSPIFDGLFLFSVAVIWSMILYQLVLSFFGYRYRQNIEKEWEGKEIADDRLPGVSILIPSRNEAVVIAKTLERISSLDYPEDKMEIVVINDGSTDDTSAIVKGLFQSIYQMLNIHAVIPIFIFTGLTHWRLQKSRSPWQ